MLIRRTALQGSVRWERNKVIVELDPQQAGDIFGSLFNVKDSECQLVLIVERGFQDTA